VLTYQEPRIILQALTQSEPPSPSSAFQLFLAFQALSQTITSQNLTLAGWLGAWARLFGPSNGPLRFKSQTQDASPLVVATLPTAKDGIYHARALCSIQREDGLGGTVTIAATFSKFAGGLSLIRSDRLLAQLSPPVVGVEAAFAAASGASIQLCINGKSGMVLCWDNAVTVNYPV
jgi:hypothetical protein